MTHCIYDCYDCAQRRNCGEFAKRTELTDSLRAMTCEFDSNKMLELATRVNQLFSEGVHPISH